MKLRVIEREADPRHVRVNLPHKLALKMDGFLLYYQQQTGVEISEQEFIELAVEAIVTGDKDFLAWQKGQTNGAGKQAGTQKEEGGRSEAIQ